MRYQEKYQSLTNDLSEDIEWTEKVKAKVKEEQKSIDSQVTPTNDIDAKRENVRVIIKHFFLSLIIILKLFDI